MYQELHGLPKEMEGESSCRLPQRGFRATAPALQPPSLYIQQVAVDAVLSDQVWVSRFQGRAELQTLPL